MLFGTPEFFPAIQPLTAEPEKLWADLGSRLFLTSIVAGSRNYVNTHEDSALARIILPFKDYKSAADTVRRWISDLGNKIGKTVQPVIYKQ